MFEFNYTKDQNGQFPGPMLVSKKNGPIEFNMNHETDPKWSSNMIIEHQRKRLGAY
ncbi:hypothetical protein Ct9H90mP29_02700 [bacterium]|nr:MAG: hypothetical protein Ct9H90mP29_02700 [bacterium]